MAETRSGQIVTKTTMIGTNMSMFRTIRAAGEEDGAAAIADWTAFNILDTEPAAGKVDLLPIFGNSYTKLVLAFYGNQGTGFDHAPAEDDTAGIEVIGYMREAGGSSRGGPPVLIASTAAGGVILGTQTYDTVVDGGDTLTAALWVDTITLDLSDWLGGVAVYDSGNNRVAWLVIGDPAGLAYLYIRRFTCLGDTSAGESPSLGCVGWAY